MAIGCIIQARMGSSRLPGKVLMKITEEYTVLDYLLMQLKYCKKIDRIIIATSTSKKDDVISDFCEKQKIDCFRGDEKNVLDRYYKCSKKFALSNIIRIPADKPLIDPEIVDSMIDTFMTQSYDYITNFLPSTFPSGTEVEIFSFSAIEKTWMNAKLPSEKEHVTKYIYNNRDKFSIYNVENDKDLSRFRWAVDTNDDLLLVKEIVSRIQKKPILTRDIIELFGKEPDLTNINKNVNRKEGNEKSELEDKEFLKSIGGS